MMAEAGFVAEGEIPLEDWPQLASGYTELARFWVSDGRAITLVSPSVAWSPALLGSLLVECVQTAADAYAKMNFTSRAEALAELWRGFDEERERLGAEEIVRHSK